nr:hypothetical protein [Tanacetum cinerariifolium]
MEISKSTLRFREEVQQSLLKLPRTKTKEAKAAKPTSEPKPKPTPTQPTKAAPEKKRKLVQKTPNEPSPTKRSNGILVRKIRKPMSSLKLVDEPSAEDVQGPARPVVIREPDFGRSQPLPEVQGKGKEKVVEEQVAHDLLTLQTPKNKSHVDHVLNTLRYVAKDSREIFGMPIHDALLIDEIKGAPYYNKNQEHVAKHQQHFNVEHGNAAGRGATESSKATKD